MMRKLLLLLLLALGFNQLRAQKVVGPVEKKLTDSLCSCITKLDQSKITTSQEAQAAFMDCFTKQSSMLVELADERKISIDDEPAMHGIGVDIGKNLLTQQCSSFMKLAVKMANKKDVPQNSYTQGSFKRIDQKGFNYIVLTDYSKQEKSFIWLRQFPGSENFMNGSVKYAGKKVRIQWQEIEVYLPQAKGYYKVKEIKNLELL